MNTVYFYAQFRVKLQEWTVGTSLWSLQKLLNPAAEHASYWGRTVTEQVWKLVQSLRWTDLEIAISKIAASLGMNL